MKRNSTAGLTQGQPKIVAILKLDAFGWVILNCVYIIYNLHDPTVVHERYRHCN